MILITITKFLKIILYRQITNYSFYHNVSESYHKKCFYMYIQGVQRLRTLKVSLTVLARYQEYALVEIFWSMSLHRQHSNLAFVDAGKRICKRRILFSIEILAYAGAGDMYHVFIMLEREYGVFFFCCCFLFVFVLFCFVICFLFSL